MNGLIKTSFSVLFISGLFACEDLPSPYNVLSQLDLTYKGFANSEDYSRVYKDLKLMSLVDLDKNKQVTVNC